MQSGRPASEEPNQKSPRRLSGHLHPNKEKNLLRLGLHLQNRRRFFRRLLLGLVHLEVVGDRLVQFTAPVALTNHDITLPKHPLRSRVEVQDQFLVRLNLRPAIVPLGNRFQHLLVSRLQHHLLLLLPLMTTLALGLRRRRRGRRWRWRLGRWRRRTGDLDRLIDQAAQRTLHDQNELLLVRDDQLVFLDDIPAVLAGRRRKGHRQIGGHVLGRVVELGRGNVMGGHRPHAAVHGDKDGKNTAHEQKRDSRQKENDFHVFLLAIRVANYPCLCNVGSGLARQSAQYGQP